ncbi:MAG: hypothetical protein VX335_01405 [Pseudomonadota bacterium]|nr:hypothetical protein [Pseudomonadota bacterium]
MKDSKKIPTDKDLLDLLFSDEKLLVIGDKLFELLRQEKAFAKHKILTYILYEYANNITYNFLLENHPRRLDNRYKVNPLQQVLKDYWKKSMYSSPLSLLVTSVIKEDVPPYLKNTILLNRISPTGALTIADVQDPSTVNAIVNSLLRNKAKVLDVDIISKLLNERNEQGRQRAKLLETFIDFLDDAFKDGELNFAKKPDIDERDKKSFFNVSGSTENKSDSASLSKNLLLNLVLDNNSGEILNPFQHSSSHNSLVELRSSTQNPELGAILEVLIKKYEDIVVYDPADGLTSSESELSSLPDDNISELSDDDNYQNYAITEESGDDDMSFMHSVNSGYSSFITVKSSIDNNNYEALNSTESEYDESSGIRSLVSMSSSGSIPDEDYEDAKDLNSYFLEKGLPKEGSSFVRFDGNEIAIKNNDNRLDQDAVTEDIPGMLPYVGHQTNEYAGNLDDHYNNSSKEGERKFFLKFIGCLLFPLKIIFYPVIILYKFCFTSGSKVESDPITTNDLHSESSLGVGSRRLVNSSVSRDGSDDKISKESQNRNVI